MSKAPENRKMNLDPKRKKRQIDLESAYRLLITAFLRTASTDSGSSEQEDEHSAQS